MSDLDDYDAMFGHDLAAAFRHNGSQPIDLGDVAEVIAEWTDGDGEPAFAWLLRLKDGRYAAGFGSHDYTGWDCRSSLTVKVFATKQDAIEMGLTAEDRQRLGLSLPGEAFP